MSLSNFFNDFKFLDFLIYLNKFTQPVKPAKNKNIQNIKLFKPILANVNNEALRKIIFKIYKAKEIFFDFLQKQGAGSRRQFSPILIYAYTQAK